jgi:hypothetical protein
MGEYFALALVFGVLIGVLAYYVTYNAFRNKSRGDSETLDR